MADLHRYVQRMQFFRVVSIDALNEQHAKTLGEEDTALVGDCDVCKALTATLTATGVGNEGGQTLNRYDVRLKVRRNYITDAIDQQDSRFWTEQDIDAQGGAEAGSLQPQQSIQIQQKTGNT